MIIAKLCEIMTPELIISIISLAGTIFIGVLTLIVNHKISKINNIKDYKENNKHITPFELQFRDEDWLYDLIVNRDEFYKYDSSSQKRIAHWFQEYAKNHTLTKLKVNNSAEESKEQSEEQVNIEEEIQAITQDFSIPAGRGELRIPDIETIRNITKTRGKKKDNTPKVIIPQLRDYPIKNKVIRPTSIIIDLEDEFDREDKK